MSRVTRTANPLLQTMIREGSLSADMSGWRSPDGCQSIEGKIVLLD